MRNMEYQHLHFKALFELFDAQVGKRVLAQRLNLRVFLFAHDFLLPLLRYRVSGADYLVVTAYVRLAAQV
jgi:hypothetical protein